MRPERDDARYFDAHPSELRPQAFLRSMAHRHRPVGFRGVRALYESPHAALQVANLSFHAGVPGVLVPADVVK